MKDMEDIKIAREETDLEWRPVLDGVHAYADLRRLGRRLAAERHVTDETIACLTGELERAIADVGKLTRERDEARAEVEDLRGRTVQQLLIEVETREDARTEATRLRAALRLAEGPIAIAASYADQPCETMGMRGHAKDCARVLPEIRAALAGEGEVLDRAHTVDVDLCTVHAVDMQPAPVDEHQVNKTRMLRFRLRQGEPLYICLTQGRQIVIKVDPRYGGAGEEPTHTPTPEQARPA